MGSTSLRTEKRLRKVNINSNSFESAATNRTRKQAPARSKSLQRMVGTPETRRKVRPCKCKGCCQKRTNVGGDTMGEDQDETIKGTDHSNLIAIYRLFLGVNKRVYNHVPGACSAVAGFEHGAVDIELLHSGNVVASSGLRLFNKTISDTLKGGTIHSYNISAKTSWEMPIKSKSIKTENFNPHGIGYFYDANTANGFLYVINHRKKLDSVEVFRINDKTSEPSLIHVKTVKSPLFKYLRDVVPVSKEEFYVTSYYYFDNPTWQGAEDYLGTSLGSVIHFDGKNATYVHRWIPSPTGVALDKSKKYLYVASIARDAIIVFKISKDGSLSQFSEIALGTSPYNIWIDPMTADLYVGCHPVKMKHFRHEVAPKDIYSPSQVLKVSGRPAKGVWRLSEVYANDGATLSGGSAAVKTKGHLLVGSIHDKLLVCELEAPHLL